jgi:serine/threonine-protein phosphatase 5
MLHAALPGEQEGDEDQDGDCYPLSSDRVPEVYVKVKIGPEEAPFEEAAERWAEISAEAEMEVKPVLAAFRLVQRHRFSLDMVPGLLADMRAGKLPNTELVEEMLGLVSTRLMGEPNVVEVRVPGRAILVGDTHGMVINVFSLFEKCGPPNADNIYVFNGDYVDRGFRGCEIIIALIALKLACWESIYFGRGNHEDWAMNGECGFQAEVVHKFGLKMMLSFGCFFATLPLAHIVDGFAFVVHGGLVREAPTIESIQGFDRIARGLEGVICDMLTAEPILETGFARCERGTGFGPDVTSEFLRVNGLKILIRSHTYVHDGCGWAHNGLCLTIHSWPDRFDAWGGVIVINEGRMRLCKFLNMRSVAILVEMCLTPEFWR